MAIDLFCGLGGWTDGLLAENFRVVGFDIECHNYGDGKQYPAQLVLQDVMTIHGSQFKDAALIVASPPCQCFSYMAMPWSKAKAIEADYKSGKRDVKQLTALFDACFRIQREACEASGHHIPMVVENVRGAQKWVGRSRWNFGSFHLWGDVPALMPIPAKIGMKGSVGTVNGSGKHREQSSWDRLPKGEGNKTAGMNWSNQELRGQDFTRIAGKHAEGTKGIPHKPTGHWTNPEENGKKGVGIGSISCGEGKSQRHPNDPRNTWSGSKSRKAASAAIAKIPVVLARHIAWAWKPKAHPTALT